MLNNHILEITLSFCHKAHLKKLITLSRKHYNVNKYLLTHKFTKDEFSCINPNVHYRIHCIGTPHVYHNRITILDLSNCQLTSLGESMCLFPQLQKLDISRNQLTSLPESVHKLKQLTII